VQLARTGYDLAKKELEEARYRMRNSEEELTPADSYKPMQPGAPNIKFIDELGKKMVIRDYLDAFKYYLIAKLEYERLLAALNEEQRSASPIRPSDCSRCFPERPLRGPAVIDQKPNLKPKQPPQGPSDKEVEPTKEGIKKAVLEAEKEMSTGGDDAKAELLLQAAGRAADKMLEKSIEEVNKNPSEEALRGMFGDMAASQALGSERADQLTQEGMNAAVGCTGLIKDKAEKEFRRMPTKENFKKYFSKVALYQLVGGSDKDNNSLRGVKRRLPPGDYTIEQGDTLSTISEKYYGHQGYWDVIYFANLTRIGNNPDIIPPGITLKIP
jgi:LysM repeat protein